VAGGIDLIPSCRLRSRYQMEGPGVEIVLSSSFSVTLDSRNDVRVVIQSAK